MTAAPVAAPGAPPAPGLPVDRHRIHVLVDGEQPGRMAAARQVAATLGAVQVTTLRAGADGPRSDPYRLGRHLRDVPADAAVLVAPRRRGPRRLVTGPVVAGRPVAIVQADAVADLPVVTEAPDPQAPWVVAAMAKNVFLDATDHWAETLAAGGRHVVDLRADRARRDDLVAGLAAGPRIVLYAGHGRTRGWAGYQALRFHHLVDPGRRRAVGLTMASAVRTDDAEALAEVAVDVLARTRPATVGDFVAALDRVVPAAGPARRAWGTFRLVGRPDTAIA